MNNKTIDKKQFIIYLIAAFGLGYIIQIIASLFALKGNVAMFGYLMSGCMFAPFIATLISRRSLKGIGWVPHLKGKVRWVFFALWMPSLLALLGAVLYFIIFPGHFDPELTLMKESLGEAGMAQLAAQGLTLKGYIIVGIIQSLTTAAFLNMFFAVGEETGWRGTMYPYLKERFGKNKGRVIGGIIWGAWHWPCMLIAGYEYGMSYIGAPILGLIVFCLFTTFLGILEDIVYEKSGTIWGAALLHGAINCWTLYAYITKPEYTGCMILGPATVGLISMIPTAVLAIVMSVKKGAKNA